VRFRRSIALVAVVVAGACGNDAADRPAASELTAAVLVEGLVGPTQIASDGRGGYVVAELNGGEDDGTGRVLRFESLDAEPEVMIDGLLTPTGVAVDGDLLWVMEQRTLTVGPIDEPADRRVVLADLPYNGRSEGTISAVEGGGILYDTSGSRSGGQLVDGSGTLWFLADPDAQPESYATGFKHAYAHAPAGDGRWFVTEVSDGMFDGEPPPDELVIAADGDDFGYPRCIGDRTPVAEFGVTEAACVGTPRSHALFEPRSTPTSVVVAPWDATTVLVALWVSGEVVAVPTAEEGAPHEPRVVFEDVEHPQHLLVDGDRVLLVDHGGGRILGLVPT
jgi:glucose/arabinose dehydrogenase